MRERRKIIGTLMPLNALPLPFFISGLEFLKWLHKTKQTAWQLLPLHETQLELGSDNKHVPSPYKSYGIGLDPIYLSPRVLKNEDKGKEQFLEQHKDWLSDYALFCSLRDKFGTDDWRTWEKGIRKRDPETINLWQKKLEREIESYISLQWQLHRQYAVFRREADRLGILLFGDLAYYPTVKSPLVWAHQDAFQINKDGSMSFVSGIPNTPGTHFGRQVWGHPLYSWETHKTEVLHLWKLRIKYLSTLFHTIRFDHTKAFFVYGSMDIVDPSKDSYQKGPGADVFRELLSYAHNQGLTIYAEDSGERTAELRRVLEGEHIPGIRIFRFAMKGNEPLERYACVSEYPENCVAFTSTHDTETLVSYLQTLDTQQKKILAKCVGVHYAAEASFAQDLRNAVVNSPAKTVIIPIQDWLLITDRINIPGTEKEIGDSNWQFKITHPLHQLPTSLGLDIP